MSYESLGTCCVVFLARIPPVNHALAIAPAHPIGLCAPGLALGHEEHLVGRELELAAGRIAASCLAPGHVYLRQRPVADGLHRSTPVRVLPLARRPDPLGWRERSRAAFSLRGRSDSARADGWAAHGCWRGAAPSRPLRRCGPPRSWRSTRSCSGMAAKRACMRWSPFSRSSPPIGCCAGLQPPPAGAPVFTLPAMRSRLSCSSARTSCRS